METGRRVVATDELLVDYRIAEGSVSSSMAGMARTNQATYRRALDRGRLTRRQRGIARRQLLLYRGVEEVARIRSTRQERGHLGAGEVLRAAPAVAAAALTHPDRWWRWARGGLSAGTSRV